jgi:NodT family efflux transporter outer membrane factor (OMF) lipoprotein
MVRISQCLAALPVVLLAGCAVGPDFKRPDPPIVSAFTADALASMEDQKLVANADVPEAWWRLFGSPELDALIAEATRANPDLKAAQAALKVATENMLAQGGVFLPGVQGGFDASKNKDATASLAPTAASGAPSYSLVAAHVSVSYMLDVFGGNRRQTEAAAAQAEAQRFQTEGAYITLTTNVAAAAVQEAALRGQIEATEHMIAAESDILEVLRHQSSLGEIAEGDVIAEEAALAQVRAALPPLQQKLAQQRAALAVLLGHLPNDEPTATFDLASLRLPDTLPVSVPARLVDRRPDVRAAEANLHSATAQVGVAVANMLPSITLTANAGSTVTAANALFAPGTGLWSLAGGLTQPIFQGGMLLHKKRAASAAAEQAAAQYRSTVLTAFQNVCDALHALEFDARTLREAETAARAATQSLEIARHQLDLGQVSGLALLNAQRTYEQATAGAIQARAARYSDVIGLFQALGGGWVDSGDVGQVR